VDLLSYYCMHTARMDVIPVANHEAREPVGLNFSIVTESGSASGSGFLCGASMVPDNQNLSSRPT